MANLSRSVEKLNNSTGLVPKLVHKVSHEGQFTQGCVKVFCRIKPSKEHHVLVFEENAKTVIYKDPEADRVCQKTFTFTEIFKLEEQQQIIKTICEPVLADKHHGALIFAYGVTNSGKTYTTIGTKHNPGILYYLLNNLEKPLEISAVEVYNEEFYSLTAPKNRLEDKNFPFFGYKDYTPTIVTDANLHGVLDECISSRRSDTTVGNINSSRSHAIFRIQTKDNRVIAVVDLAGSQKFEDGENGKETCNINKSLLTLGRCIQALKRQKQNSSSIPIPYRDSKLTKALMEFFNSKFKLYMIVTINPIKKELSETLKALEYAATAKEIRYLEKPKEVDKSKEKTRPPPQFGTSSSVGIGNNQKWKFQLWKYRNEQTNIQEEEPGYLQNLRSVLSGQFKKLDDRMENLKQKWKPLQQKALQEIDGKVKMDEEEKKQLLQMVEEGSINLQCQQVNQLTEQMLNREDQRVRISQNLKATHQRIKSAKKDAGVEGQKQARVCFQQEEIFNMKQAQNIQKQLDQSVKEIDKIRQRMKGNNNMTKFKEKFLDVLKSPIKFIKGLYDSSPFKKPPPSNIKRQPEISIPAFTAPVIKISPEKSIGIQRQLKVVPAYTIYKFEVTLRFEVENLPAQANTSPSVPSRESRNQNLKRSLGRDISQDSFQGYSLTSSPTKNVRECKKTKRAPELDQSPNNNINKIWR